MFEPSERPRIFALPPGADFPSAIVARLTRDFANRPPEALARVDLIVNTSRMARRIAALFDEGGAILLPRIRLLSDLSMLGDGALDGDLIAPVPPIRRRLELTRLVSRFLDQAPDFAPRAALYDLADSLAALLGEMQGEGVPPSAIAALDVEDQSGHWARTKAFLEIVQHYFDETGEPPDAEALQRRRAERLAALWQEAPPQHPVILAGSTGSRGATRLLMEAVARLPQGALVLPGFDFDLPVGLWETLDNALLAEDHPQFRYRTLMTNLGLAREDIMRWDDTAPPSPARNRLISLALRPAPVTDQWLSDGPALGDLHPAAEGMSLIEATSQREEATAIALRLRKAAEDGTTAALITPDRMLSRQVAAALDRWNILPDDSAGQPLPLSPVGRLLRHVAALFDEGLSAESLLTLLKHPLTHMGADRGNHLRFTRDLELHLRRWAPPYPDADDLRAWAIKQDDADVTRWAEWLCSCFTGQETVGEQPLSAMLETHLALCARISKGSTPGAAAHLWAERDGKEARKLLDQLAEAADAADPLSARAYSDLFGSILATGEVRRVEEPHPHILIWGTLEARVQGADLVILGGLNEGSWPEMPAPDPWLNRQMRHRAGLLLPERRIGLSAHDFQQAIAAKEVWLTRAIKTDDAETVPSRWVNRLLNLMQGLPEQHGEDAVKAMKNRGDEWRSLARALDTPDPVPPAHRPAPIPPTEARPRRLSVTEIKTLIRDPYAIYARRILRLNPLDPLMRLPDAATRGIVLHEVMEHFIKHIVANPADATRDRLLEITDAALEGAVPWPAARLMWRARVERIADSFLADEANRQSRATPLKYEVKGHADLPQLGFTLRGTADRIDQADGGLILYDYKTGSPPTKAQQKNFDKQLLLEAVIAEKGGFTDIPASTVIAASYIGLGAKPGEAAAPLEETTPAQIWQEFVALITAYLSPDQGFLSRRAMFKSEETGNYDQLARYGEWDIADDPVPEVLK
ncbi:double-strand break repair protein AddB [Rhodalgimonas zhirmunskyi]|uniref:Double-strand break repair protein AddB n=1 Tax=Rhodalgimonas zhirmunskyi TaxID=2964767 RepID=A0AAJ1X7A6_9RHOB|nr:double-strand break repair protein AddB [Rhodoalgimonas zhirmunskyi]MDQ2094327.1 double-strand break repair protein AddB [Rhodoalgimonas zhirmunskyi]